MWPFIKSFIQVFSDQCGCKQSAKNNMASKKLAMWSMMKYDSLLFHTSPNANVTFVTKLFQERYIIHQQHDIVRKWSRWRRQHSEGLSVDVHSSAITHAHTFRIIHSATNSMYDCLLSFTSLHFHELFQFRLRATTMGLLEPMYSLLHSHQCQRTEGSILLSHAFTYIHRFISVKGHSANIINKTVMTNVRS